MSVRSRAFLLPLLLALMAYAQPALAQAPVKQTEFAWGLVAYTGKEYTSVFSPKESPSLYVLAGRTHVLLPHLTQVYFWPIDREYKADWAALDENVVGALVILGGGNTPQRVERQPYLMVPQSDHPSVVDQLLLGQAATDAYHQYEQERDAYLGSVAAYDAQLEAYMKARALDPKADVPAPTEPAPFGKAMQPPGSGFAINLRAGNYPIYLAGPDGKPVPGSERTLISIDPRRASAGYSVIPESKWTLPEPSDVPANVIYYSPDNKSLYLQPFQTVEYNEQQFTRLEKPQDTGASADRWVWIHDTPLDGVQLQVWAGDRMLAQVDKSPFSVQQLPGAALGYQVVPFDPQVARASDFEAFKVSPAPGITNLTVRMVRADGTVVPGSERMLVRASPDLPYALYGLALIPLVARLGVGLQRRRKRQKTLAALREL